MNSLEQQLDYPFGPTLPELGTTLKAARLRPAAEEPSPKVRGGARRLQALSCRGLRKCHEKTGTGLLGGFSPYAAAV